MENVGLLVGDEDDEKLLQRLVYVAHMVSLDRGVLLSAASQLGEGCNQAFDSGAGHLSELTRDEGYGRTGERACVSQGQVSHLFVDEQKSRSRYLCRSLCRWRRREQPNKERRPGSRKKVREKA